MHYKIQSKGVLIVDGQMIDAGAIVGTLETPLELSNIISALWCGDMRAVPVETFTQEAATDIRQVRRDRDPIDATDAIEPSAAINPPAADDPDALNALDAIEQSTEPNSSVENSETSEPIAEPFPGLPKRIADSLIAAGLTDRATVAEIATDGADAFLEYDGIGKSAARKIIEWLHL